MLEISPPDEAEELAHTWRFQVTKTSRTELERLGVSSGGRGSVLNMYEVTASLCSCLAVTGTIRRSGSRETRREALVVAG